MVALRAEEMPWRPPKRCSFLPVNGHSIDCSLFGRAERGCQPARPPALAVGPRVPLTIGGSKKRVVERKSSLQPRQYGCGAATQSLIDFFGITNTREHGACRNTGLLKLGQALRPSTAGTRWGKTGLEIYAGRRDPGRVISSSRPPGDGSFRSDKISWEHSESVAGDLWRRLRSTAGAPALLTTACLGELMWTSAQYRQPAAPNDQAGLYLAAHGGRQGPLHDQGGRNTRPTIGTATGATATVAVTAISKGAGEPVAQAWSISMGCRESVGFSTSVAGRDSAAACSTTIQAAAAGGGTGRFRRFTSRPRRGPPRREGWACSATRRRIALSVPGDGGRSLIVSMVSLGTLHNPEDFRAADRVAGDRTGLAGRTTMSRVESYRRELEQFNMQCWALTCEAFFDTAAWIWLFRHFGATRTAITSSSISNNGPLHAGENSQGRRSGSVP